MNRFLRFTLLLTFGIVADCDQLQNLINFVQGGSNPVAGGGGLGAATGQRPRPGSATAGRLPSPQAVSPIPFAEVADPSRGVVALDVPQPKVPQANPQQLPQQHAQQQQHQHQRPVFGLPAGASQVGGRPLHLRTQTKKKPAPLSEVEAPIFLSNTFPSPLNGVSPPVAPVIEPVDSTLQRFSTNSARVPRPTVIPVDGFPALVALQDQADRFSSGQLDYNRFSNQVYNNQGSFESAQLDGQHLADFNNLGHQAQQQVDIGHAEAIRRHQEQVEEVKRLQQERQRLQVQLPVQVDQPPQQQQQRHHQPQATNQGHFQIPAAERHRQFVEELRLAQEALKSLG